MSADPSPHPPVRVRVAARTEVGRRCVRNQDTFVVGDPRTRLHIGPDPLDASFENSAPGVVLSVIDAMGGISSSDAAARITAGSFAASLGEVSAQGAETWRVALVAAMQRASYAIADARRRDRRLQGTAAAAVLGVVDGDLLHLASVGDARAYLLRLGRLVQVTRDDTLLNAWYAHGGKGFDAYSVPPHVITQALGLSDALEVPSASLQLRAGDVLLLESNGLHRSVDEAVIARALRDLADPGEACRALVRLANRGHGHDDDVTVVVARPEGVGLRSAGPEDALQSRNVP